MKRTVAIMTLASMMNVFIGCTVKHVPLSAAEKSSGGTIRSIVFQVTIDGYMTTKGEQILFADHTGKYDADSRTILGEFPDGSATEVSIDDVSRIRLREGTVNGQMNRWVDPALFLWSARRNPWRTCGNESVQAGEVIKFDQRGASYDSLSNVLKGTSMNGDSVTAVASDIYMVGKRRFSAKMLLATGAIVLTLYLIISTVDLEWGPTVDLGGI